MGNELRGTMGTELRGTLVGVRIAPSQRWSVERSRAAGRYRLIALRKTGPTM